MPFYGATTPGEPVAREQGGQPIPAAAQAASDISFQQGPREQPKAIIVDGSAAGRDRPVLEAAAREAVGGGVTLNFVNTSLPKVVQAVLGDILKLNYVIDPKLTGDVTVETTEPIPRDALMATFETILKVNGAAVVQGDGVYKVVPLDQATKSAPPILGSRGNVPGVPGFRVQVVPLLHVSAADMQAVLEPVALPGGVLRVDPVRNILVLAGSRQDLKAMMDVVDTFDVDWLRGQSFGLFPIQYADAQTMVGELERVLGPEQGADLSSIVRFVPIDRLNAVLAIARTKDTIDLVGEWIGRLDRSWNQNDQRIFVYPVQNGKAIDLAAIINDLFGGSGGDSVRRSETVAPRLQRRQIGGGGGYGGTGMGGSTSSLGRSTPIAQTSSLGARNSLTGLGAGSTQTAAAAGAATGGAVAGGGGAAAGAGATASRSTGPAPGARPLSDFADLRVIPDEANNSLVILGTPAQYRTVETTLRRLDIVPLQVLIEATIAEVTLNDDLRYGVQWFFEFGNKHQAQLRTLNSAPGLASSGFSYFFSQSSGDVKAALDLLAEVSDVKVISSPHLMVLGNQTAYLQVGDQVPVETRTSTSTTNPDAPIVREIAYRDTGVILTVTPRVNPGGLVTLDIEQEASSVAATTTGVTESPTIQQRRISSSVAVQSGESVALGGLIRDDITKSRSGIPILGDIPILGNLFSRTADLQGRTELIIVLTPRVVSSSPDAARVTQELRSRMKGLQKWNPLP